MFVFILRRIGLMILTALCLTFIVFFLTNLAPNLEKLARTEGSVRMTDESVPRGLWKTAMAGLSLAVMRNGWAWHRAGS